MRIGELARKIGVTTHAIRYYERIGLLANPTRSPSGYRLYDDRAVEFLRFIRKAQTLGFNLKEIKTIWEIASEGRKPCGYVLRLAEKKLRNVERKIGELREFRLLFLSLLGRGESVDSAEDTSCAVCPLIEGAKEN